MYLQFSRPGGGHITLTSPISSKYFTVNTGEEFSGPTAINKILRRIARCFMYTPRSFVGRSPPVQKVGSSMGGRREKKKEKSRAGNTRHDQLRGLCRLVCLFAIVATNLRLLANTNYKIMHIITRSFNINNYLRASMVRDAPYVTY